MAICITQPLLWDGSLFGAPCDGGRNVESRPVVIPMGADATLRLEFRDRETFALTLPDACADVTRWRFEITDKRGIGHTCLYASSDVACDISANEITINCAGTYTIEMEAALGERTEGEFPAFLSGFDANGKRIVSVMFRIRIGNTTDSDADPEEASSANAKIDALAAALNAAINALKTIDASGENPTYGDTDAMLLRLITILQNTQL